MALPRRPKYRSDKKRPYRSFKKRKPYGDVDASVLAVLLLLGGIIWIIGTIL